MEMSDVIRSRRAVREYASQPVDRTTIKRLISYAAMAPSAENHQPWEFAVLLDSKRVDMYADRAKAWLLANPAVLTLDKALPHMLANTVFSIFYHAPALVIVVAKYDDLQSKKDCCLAAQNFMLAARDVDLGTCWVGLSHPWFDLPETKAELGIPAAHAVVAPIVVGHPKQWPKPHERMAPRTYWI